MVDKINDSYYEIEIGGLLDNNSPVKMVIKFLKDSITIDIIINRYNITGSFTYLISTDVIKEIQNIKRNDDIVHYLNRDLPTVDNPYKSITDFDQPNNLKWFILPWKAIYGINNNVQEISENEKIIEIYNMYVDYDSQSSFIKKEYFSKSYKRNNTSNIFAQSIILDEAIKNTIGVCLNKDDNTYIIETAFLDTTHPNGYYDEKLRGKYFYHILQSNSIKDIDKEKLISISKDDGILDSGDISNDSLILKLVRGK